MKDNSMTLYGRERADKNSLTLYIWTDNDKIKDPILRGTLLWDDNEKLEKDFLIKHIFEFMNTASSRTGKSIIEFIG